MSLASTKKPMKKKATQEQAEETTSETATPSADDKVVPATPSPVQAQGKWRGLISNRFPAGVVAWWGQWPGGSAQFAG